MVRDAEQMNVDIEVRNLRLLTVSRTAWMLERSADWKVKRGGLYDRRGCGRPLSDLDAVNLNDVVDFAYRIVLALNESTLVRMSVVKVKHSLNECDIDCRPVEAVMEKCQCFEKFNDVVKKVGNDAVEPKSEDERGLA